MCAKWGPVQKKGKKWDPPKPPKNVTLYRLKIDKSDILKNPSPGAAFSTEALS
jgi:hypothetical protein